MRIASIIMKTSNNLIDAIQRDKIANARRMSPERKLLAGLELFDLNCALILGALKAQYPDADAARLNELLQERLAKARKLESGL
ncbi:MAG TPA: hypothetical protein VMG59_05225 [Phycisphaerae bacterium]|nr:hypothetical protein [Phycisphaerae bacterium]